MLTRDAKISSGDSREMVFLTVPTKKASLTEFEEHEFARMTVDVQTLFPKYKKSHKSVTFLQALRGINFAQ